MPSYPSVINRHVEQASPGLPVYLLGSFSYTTAPTRMNITNVALTSNVATLTVKVIEGNLPVAGQLIYVSGCSNTAFNNATGIAISSVSFTNSPEDGIGTVSYALTHADVVSAAATGRAVAPVAEVGEALADGASVACALQANVGPENPFDIRVDVSFPSAGSITAVTLTAQSAALDIDSEYQDLAQIVTVSSGTPTSASIVVPDVMARFIRIKTSSLSGTGTVVAKVTV